MFIEFDTACTSIDSVVGASKPLIRPETLVADDININNEDSDILINIAFWETSAPPEYPNCSGSINVESDATL